MGVQRPAVRGQRAEVRGQSSGFREGTEGVARGQGGGDGAKRSLKHTGARPVDGAGRGGGDLLEQVGVCSGAFEDEVVAIYAVD